MAAPLAYISAPWCLTNMTRAKPAALDCSMAKCRIPSARRSSLVTMSQEVIEETAVSAEEHLKAPQVVKHQVERRRNLAIISHPDSGKTSLTEKLLLYGGAINQAGAVRARRSSGQKMAISDYMKMEQERGISITSTVLTFEYDDKQINIIDTPGHSDFSEDTYRVLSVADNAVMLMDGAKGLEPQTRKLFEISQLRKIPVITFINKMDRPAVNPYSLCDDIEKEFKIEVAPITWPIGTDGDDFTGVYERSTGFVHLFERGERTKKAQEIPKLHCERDREELEKRLGERLWNQLQEDILMLDEMMPPFDLESFYAGDLTPIFFGSAITNFGVELLLHNILKLGQAPPPRSLLKGGMLEPTNTQFSGIIFKLVANSNPAHRDKVAYCRVVSGVFERGMKVNSSRLKNGKQITLSRPQKLFGAERDVIDVAYPGDVVGLNNPGAFAIGDTLYVGKEPVEFPSIPSFSPEIFAYIKSPQPSQRKNFIKGLNQLLDEGAVQMLRSRKDMGNEDPILAAIGQLQFEVVQSRLLDEYGVETQLEPLSYAVARWITGPGDPWKALDDCGPIYNVFFAKDRWERPVLLFKNSWNLNQLIEDHPKLELAEWAFAPASE